MTYRDFVVVFNKTVISLVLVGYEMADNQRDAMFTSHSRVIVQYLNLFNFLQDREDSAQFFLYIKSSNVKVRLQLQHSCYICDSFIKKYRMNKRKTLFFFSV